MSGMPAVSVTMATHNVERYVAEAVQSVLDQTFEGFELIIRDDGSTDGTRRETERFRDPRIRVLDRTDHVGVGAARNEMLAHARGEYLAVIDADDVAEPTLLAKKIAYLQMHPEIAVLGCTLYRMDPDGTVRGMKRFPTDSDFIQVAQMERTALAQPGIVVRAGAIRTVGGYRPSLPCSEDYDLHLRLLEGFNAANLEEPLYRYRTSPGQSTTAKRQLHALWHQRNWNAMRQRRLTGRDNLDPSAPDTGVLHMETRSREDAAHVYCLWSRGFCGKPFHDVAAARACPLKAIRLVPWRRRGWTALARVVALC